MIRFLIPAIFLGTSLLLFFTFTNPIYEEIKNLRNVSASYNDALGNSKALEAERDKLTAKYNSISQTDIAKLEKLLPDGVDNIRLVLEIEKLALPYGMVLKDVGYDASNEEEETKRDQSVESGRLPYGVWNLSFSTSGTYNNFVNFLRDLENNLRIVDISSIDFSAEDMPGLNPNIPQAYNYDFAIQTYWLKK